ncbi:MAG TPA: hemolysin family protein [Anaerolineaceae bacterium]
MPGWVVEGLVILLLILLNGVLSLSEIAIISSRKSRLQQRAEEGDVSSRTALAMAEQPGSFLATIQIGITLVGILTGVISGVTITKQFGILLNSIAWINPYGEVVSGVIIVIVITYFSLVLGELVPKQIALANPERVASRIAPPMQLLARLASPFAKVLDVSSRLVLGVLRVKKSNDPPVTEDEIQVLLEQGTQVGVFEEAEQDMVKGVFRLSDRRVDALMTPRTDIVWLDLDEDEETNIQKVLDSPHNYFPVGAGSLDEVQGILNSKDLLARLRSCQTVDFRDLLLPALFVPESTPALKVLEMLKSSSGNLALVIDEYGGLLGMVTLFDVLQSIVGEIPMQGEEIEPMAVQREDGSWLMDGLLPVDELKEIIGVSELPEESRVGYQTVGGLMMTMIGAIPVSGQHFEWEGLHFEVVDMDGRRVDKVLIERKTPDPEERS